MTCVQSPREQLPDKPDLQSGWLGLRKKLAELAEREQAPGHLSDHRKSYTVNKSSSLQSKKRGDAYLTTPSIRIQSPIK
ncbi:hypothetical protein scyTo_0020398 [Scyliorhinus torazame]|uniref:Uncharacterized protein n=1 Tax=Scyliorhinus torazame TaxID=75743 RepID=A0A401PRQ3_SCYTO|nr:hypothetical protein [Scyliorhinus torazame]